MICRQHGGNYGQNELIFEEKHEIKICDYFYTWGWKDRNKKVLPFFGIIEPKLKPFKEREKILLVTQTLINFYILIMEQWIIIKVKIILIL